jgi:hypothetical protein
MLKAGDKTCPKESNLVGKGDVPGSRGELPSQAQEGCSPDDRSQGDAWQHEIRR